MDASPLHPTPIMAILLLTCWAIFVSFYKISIHSFRKEKEKQCTISKTYGQTDIKVTKIRISQMTLRINYLQCSYLTIHRSLTSFLPGYQTTCNPRQWKSDLPGQTLVKNHMHQKHRAIIIFWLTDLYSITKQTWKHKESRSTCICMTWCTLLLQYFRNYEPCLVLFVFHFKFLEQIALIFVFLYNSKSVFYLHPVIMNDPWWRSHQVR